MFQEKTLDVPFNGSEFMYIDSLFSLELFNTEINSMGLLEYDEDFFTLKALVIFTCNITSSEKDIKTKSIRLNENKLIIELHFNKPGESYTDDFRAKTFVLEMNKENISELDVYPYNTANKVYESYYYGGKTTFLLKAK